MPGVYAAGDACTIVWTDQSPHWFQMRLWTQASCPSSSSSSSSSAAAAAAAAGHGSTSHAHHCAGLHDTPHCLNTGAQLAQHCHCQGLPNHCALRINQLSACLIDSQVTNTVLPCVTGLSKSVLMQHSTHGYCNAYRRQLYLTNNKSIVATDMLLTQ